MQIQTFQSESEWIQSSLKTIQGSIKNADGDYHIALSGGSTPKPIYSLMSSSGLTRGSIHFWQVDERYVPVDHPASNQKMITNAFLDSDPRSMHTFDTTLSIEECLKKYQEDLELNLPGQQFDLTILGIGTDGHFASIFPKENQKDPESTRMDASIFPNTASVHDGHDRHPTTHAAIHTQAPPQFNIQDRLTLTPPIILRSKQILILLKGESKLPIIKELQNPTKSFSEFPALRLAKAENLTINYYTSSS